MKATQVLDVKGEKCPLPTFKMTTLVNESLKPGNILEVIADCPTFEDDVKVWCRRFKKILLWIRDEGSGVKRCQVQI